MNEIEGKIPGITGLVTSALLTTFENKISDVSNLVEKKTDYNAKMTDIENKYISKTNYNKFTKNIAERIKKMDFLRTLILLMW